GERTTEPASRVRRREVGGEAEEARKKGPQPPLRDGERTGAGHPALLERRAGAGLSTVDGVQAEEVCPEEQSGAGHGDADYSGAGDGRGGSGGQQQKDRSRKA